MPNSVASARSNLSLIPSNLNSRKKQSPNVVTGGKVVGDPSVNRRSASIRSGTPRSLGIPGGGAAGGSRRGSVGGSVASFGGSRPASHMSQREEIGDPMLLQSGNAEIKDMVKDAVKEYFDSLNLPQLNTHRGQPAGGATEFKGYNEEGEEVWAVVKKDPMEQLMNTTASRPNSRMANLRGATGGGVAPPPNGGIQRSKTQYWNDDVDFQNNLQNWASSAPNHEREIVKNLLKRLNGGQTPAEMNPNASQTINTERIVRPTSAYFEPIQYQCDLSMFTKPPYNPLRHFTINPEWTSERYTVKRIPAAHLHPTASLKNKLGLLRS